MKRIRQIIYVIFVGMISNSCFADLDIWACGSEDGQCEVGVSRSLCESYKDRKKDGQDWRFYDGKDSICPPFVSY